MKFLGVLLMAVCLMGCTKSNDDNNGNGGNNNGGGGGNTTDYAALISSSIWSGDAPENEDLRVQFVFDKPEKGNLNFSYGNNEDGLVANGSYSISGNVMTVTYTDVRFLLCSESWPFGHSYGFVEGQNKTVTYTFLSCTEKEMVVKESAMGDTFTMTKWDN